MRVLWIAAAVAMVASSAQAADRYGQVRAGFSDAGDCVGYVEPSILASCIASHAGAAGHASTQYRLGVEFRAFAEWVDAATVCKLKGCDSAGALDKADQTFLEIRQKIRAAHLSEGDAVVAALGWNADDLRMWQAFATKHAPD